jgi:hypothetical protein
MRLHRKKNDYKHEITSNLNACLCVRKLDLRDSRGWLTCLTVCDACGDEKTRQVHEDRYFAVDL